MDQFIATSAATLSGILKIFVVMAAAGFLVRSGVLTEAMVTALSRATVVLFLPCLIFDKITTNLDPGATPLWWVIPLTSLVMIGAGLAAAALLFAGELPEKRNMLAVASMQNSGYLILPVGLALYPDRFDEFALYTFLFVLGFNPVLWSLGKLLTTTDVPGDRGVFGWLNPPLASILSAIFLALTGLSRFIPEPVQSAVALVGEGAVPVATVVLGAMLGGMAVRLRPHLWDTVRVLIVKFGFLPVVTIATLVILGVGDTDPLLARLLVLQSAAAPAANLILQVRAYGGDEQKVGTVMLVCYAACIFSLPVWLTVWEVVS